MADIPRLGSQWKIIHEFKPTEYPQLSLPAITVTAGKPVHSGFFLTFWPGIIWLDGFFRHEYPHWTILQSSQLPKVGEWTRIEMSHEEVDGKYFLSLSVGGREAARTEAEPEYSDLKKLTDVNVTLGYPEGVLLDDTKVEVGYHEGILNQPGFLRRLVILEKR